MADSSTSSKVSPVCDDSGAIGMTTVNKSTTGEVKKKIFMKSQRPKKLNLLKIASDEGVVSLETFLKKPIRRPHSKKPPPLPRAFFSPPAIPDNLPTPEDPQLTCFLQIFTGQPVTETQVFLLIHDYVFFTSTCLQDLKKMVICLLDLGMECAVNVVPMFKALYIFTQNPDFGADIRTFVFEEVEHRFETRSGKISSGPEGPRRFRNFVKLMMALVHHYRNLNKAPIFDLVESLFELAMELSPFKFFEDVPLYVQLILRVQYYSTLSPAIKEDILPKVSRGRKIWYNMVFGMAKDTARKKLSTDRDLPPQYRRWLVMLIEAVGWPKIYKNKDLVREYKDLPGFNKLMPDELLIKLPHNCNRGDFNISHISRYVKYEEAQVDMPTLAPAKREEIPAADAE